MLRIFFERIIEWDWHDAPAGTRSSHGDFPPRPNRSPSSSTTPTPPSSWPPPERTAYPRYRLVVEILARTGLRASELCDLADDAVIHIGDGHWLRVPVGKLRNDRYVPLHPTSSSCSPTGPPPTPTTSATQRRLIADDHAPFDRRTIHRIVATVAERAGIGHVHPHQLRHTLATQAINRGMSLEAIAALLGHRSMKMTLTYARIADRIVADEYVRRAPRSTRSTTPPPHPARCPPRSRPPP